MKNLPCPSGIRTLRTRLDGGGMRGSKVELAENRPILSQIYSTLLYSTLLSLPLSQSKRTINLTSKLKT